MMRQNFSYRLKFYLKLRLVYSCDYIQEGKAKRIFLLRADQTSIETFFSEDIFNGCIKILRISLCIIRTVSKSKRL